MHLRMHCLNVLMLIFVISHDTLEFIVRGSGPLVVPLGSSVVLPCYTETPLGTEKLKVVWRRTDSDTLVHLYQDGESRSEEKQQEYHDRAHFFTDQIQHGNFSLLLENVRAEDKGVYICKVYSQQDSDKILVEIKDVEYLLVSGSDDSISASVGEDVTLNCSVDSHITPEHIGAVSWKKTDEDDILVLLYQNNETLPDSSDERYRDRVAFVTDEIPKGNFSLRLKNVRTEDKGDYMCQVFAGGLSVNATVELKILGFSVSHIMVLILCITASGSVLLVYWLVYSNEDEEDEDTSCLQVCLFHGTNIIMLLASIIWGFFEGSLYETILCCMLYILRPLRLIWFRPYITACPDKILKCITSSHADQYYAAFMVLMYSVLLAEHLKDINSNIITVAIGLLILVCLFFIIQLAEEKLLPLSESLVQILATCSFPLLPSLQLILLLYTHFVSNAVLILTVLPIPYWLFSFNWCRTSRRKQCCLSCLDKTIRTMVIVMSGVMIYLYTALLRKEKEGAGLVCVAGFVQALWVLAFSEVPVSYLNLRYRNVLFLFGSAGIVLVNSAALMTEVIMKAVNGERLVGDLRIVVLPSEWIFTLPLLILSVITPWKPINTESQSPDCKGTPARDYTSVDLNQRKGESIEMETLGEVAGSCEKQEEEINS